MNRLMERFCVYHIVKPLDKLSKRQIPIQWDSSLRIVWLFIPQLVRFYTFPNRIGLS